MNNESLELHRQYKPHVSDAFPVYTHIRKISLLDIDYNIIFKDGGDVDMDVIREWSQGVNLHNESIIIRTLEDIYNSFPSELHLGTRPDFSTLMDASTGGWEWTRGQISGLNLNGCLSRLTQGLYSACIPKQKFNLELSDNPLKAGPSIVVYLRWRVARQKSFWPTRTHISSVIEISNTLPGITGNKG